MKQYVLAFLMIIAASAIIQSCDRSGIYDKNVAIQHYLWSAGDTLSFHVNIADTLQAHNIYLNIRNSYHYEYSNIFLFISTYAPNGNFVKDTVEISLADKTGRWFGKGAANVFSLQVPYKMKIRFPHKGIYLFEIQHAMWNNSLKGITDVGLRVEKTR
jgi:gliding motility-associated lipoprotein GldH